MKKTLFSLLIGLTMAGTSVAQSDSNNHQNTDNNTYDVEMVPYFVKPGVSIDTTDLGTYLGSQKVPLQLQNGGVEEGTYSTFSFGNKKPNVISVRDPKGEIISLMFDKKSPEYTTLVESFADKIGKWK